MGSETATRAALKKAPLRPIAPGTPARQAGAGPRTVIAHSAQPEPQARVRRERADSRHKPRHAAREAEKARPRARSSSRPCPLCAVPGLVRVPRLPEDRNDPAKRGMLRMRCQAPACDFEGLLPRHRRDVRPGQEARWALQGAWQRLFKRSRTGATLAAVGAVLVGVVAAGLWAYADGPSLRGLAGVEARASLRR